MEEEPGFRIIHTYNGDPILPIVVTAQQGLPQKDAEKFVNKVARSLGSTTSVHPEATDTLYDTRQKLALVDGVAQTALHQSTILAIDAVYDYFASDITENTGGEIDDTSELLKYASKILTLEPHEAHELIANAPAISGFESSTDTNLTNEEAQDFLINGVGRRLLIEKRFLEVSKTDEYLITFPNAVGTREHKIFAEARKHGLKARALPQSARVFAIPTLEQYQELEAAFEGCAISELQHTYRNRAFSADRDRLGPAVIANHSIENIDKLDYMQDLEGLDKEQQRDIYILGSIAHEAAHEIESHDDFVAFTELLEKELAPSGEKGVTAYVREHFDSARHLTSEINTIVNEDFTETVRAFVTNAEWLRQNFPQRYAYIKDTYPTIVANAAQDTVTREK